MADERQRRRPFSLPILLVLFGLHLLAYNLGWTDWSPWLAIFTLWPLILVAIGLDLMLGRRNRWLALAVSIVVLGGLATLATAGRSGNVERYPGDEVDRVQVPLDDNAITGKVRLDLHSTDLWMKPAAESPVHLVQAVLFGSERSRLESREMQTDETTSVTLRTGRGESGSVYPLHFFGNPIASRLDLMLHPATPLDLTVDGESSDLHLNLEQLLLDKLRVDLEVGSAVIDLPAAQGRATADLDLRLASLILRIPDGTAARIRVRRTMTSVSVDSDRFKRDGRYYESPDFDTADNRWTITIRSRLGVVRVR